MSPEQARGEQVDRRTDLFSLGVIIYQMISGRLPFGAEYEQAVLYSILNEDPEALTAIRTGVPMELERIVAKALAKDRELRYQHAADLIADLKALKLTDPDSGHVTGKLSTTRVHTAITAESGVLVDAPATRPSRSFSTRALTGAVIAAISITALLFFGSGGWSSSAANMSMDVSLLTRSADGKRLQPFSQAFSRGVGISPDGKQVAFMARTEMGWELVVRDLDNATGVIIPGTSDFVESPAYSFDGNELTFGLDMQLQTANVGGGLPTALAPVDRPSRGSTWLADGSIVFAPNSATGLLRHFPDGTIRTFTQLNESIGENSHRWPNALPNGAGVIYTSKTYDLGSFDDASIFVVDVESGEVTLLFRGGTGAMYANGYLLYGKSTGLYAVSMDLETMEIGNEHLLVTDDIYVTMPSGVANFSASLNESLVVLPKPEIRLDPVQLISPRGTRVLEYSDEVIWPGLSPQGKRVIFTQHAANDGLVVLDLDSGNYVQVTTRYNNQHAIWGPDERRILFTSDRRGHFNLYEMDVDDQESARLMWADTTGLQPTFWSADGKMVLYQRGSGIRGADIWSLSMGVDTVATPVLDSEFDEMHAVLSSDGSFILYESDESGESEIYIRQYPELRVKRLISVSGGFRPRFSKDGSQIFYIAGNGRAESRTECTIEVVNFTGGSQSTISGRRTVMDNPLCSDFEIMPDGDTILLVSNSENTPYWDMPDVRLITNWTERIK